MAASARPDQPCPCGSGRRYGQCCGAALRSAADEAAPVQPAASLDRLVEIGMEAYRANRLA
jgi:uncharacterized protein YchJ